MIPNMMIDSGIGGNNNVIFRGIGSSMFTGKNPVVLYVDGVPFDQVSHYGADLVNIERVEVLRGPQGTLYGKNAIGGAINVVSKKTGNTMESKASIQAGSNETYGVKGFINGPLIKDELFFGLSANYNESRGFMKNEAPGQDYFDAKENKNAKARLRWLPTDQFEVNFHAGIDQLRNGSDTSIAPGPLRYHEKRNPHSVPGKQRAIKMDGGTLLFL